MDRYSFIAMDLHHLLLAGLPAHSCADPKQARVLGRSGQQATGNLLRPALFAAQFALSHACWLLTYPLAGWLGATAGIPMTLGVLGLVTSLGFLLAARLWPADDPEELAHAHPDLPPDHPHLRQHHGRAHAHAFTIDDLQRRWPTSQATGQDSTPVSGRT